MAQISGSQRVVVTLIISQLGVCVGVIRRGSIIAVDVSRGITLHFIGWIVLAVDMATETHTYATRTYICMYWGGQRGMYEMLSHTLPYSAARTAVQYSNGRPSGLGLGYRILAGQSARLGRAESG